MLNISPALATIIKYKEKMNEKSTGKIISKYKKCSDKS
jgi:hypothetical protein